MSKNLSSCSKRPARSLFAHMAASPLSYVSTYVPSLFLALRANSSRREVLGV